jgi:acetate kinase
MRELLSSEAPGARLAVDHFVFRIAKETGALTSVLGGLDGFVFTAGIGEHAVLVREKVCAGLAWLGMTLDPAVNARGGPRISSPESRVAAYVIPTDEERMIALHTIETLALDIREVDMPKKTRFALPDSSKIDAYWRAANYLSVGQIYLLDNPLLNSR